MTGANTSATASGAANARQMPDWDNFIPPEPEPPEDGLAQEEPHLRLRIILLAHYHDCPDALVSGGKGYYFYDRCDINAKFAPNLTIAFGDDVERIRARNAYMIWEVGKPPDFAMEIATPSAADADNGIKRELYAELGIGEYWRLDPTGGDLYGEPLIGEYLLNGKYRRYPTYRDDKGRIASRSMALNMGFYWDGMEFGINDPVTGADKRDLPEYDRALADANRTTEAERQARLAIEAEIPPYQGRKRPPPPPIAAGHPALTAPRLWYHTHQAHIPAHTAIRERTMTTAKTPTPTIARGATDTRQMPDWDNFIPPIPEPPEDAMLQELPILRVFGILEGHFRARPDALVFSGGGFIYYDRYDMNAKLAPDCAIAFGVNAARIRARRAYMVWEAGKPPDVTIEVASPSTAVRDTGVKREIYAEMGVGEYWRLDPTGGDLYGAPLVGEYLVDGEYMRYPTHRDAKGRLASRSEALNMDFYWDGAVFGIHDPVTGEDKRDIPEYDRALESERQARQAAQQAQEAAEAEIRRLREENERLRRQ